MTEVKAELFDEEFASLDAAERFMHLEAQKETGFVVFVPHPSSHQSKNWGDLGVYRVGWIPELELL